MAKQLTKEQREERDRAALRQRISDVYNGAAGNIIDIVDDDGDPQYWPTAEALSRIIPVIEEMFQEVDDDGKQQNEWLFRTNNIDKYESVDEATDFLFEYGVRA